MLLGISELRNGKIVIDVLNISSVKNSDYLSPGAPHRELLHPEFLFCNSQPNNVGESEDKLNRTIYLLSASNLLWDQMFSDFSELTHFIKLT